MPITYLEQQKQTIRSLGFNDFIDYKDSHATFQALDADNRCGVYCLAFDDVTFYIGQSVDILNRLTQHKKENNTITQFAFQKVNKEHLAFTEEYAIKAADRKGIRLRNIMHVSNTAGYCKLDEIVDTDTQEKWLYQEKPSAISEIHTRVAAFPDKEYPFKSKYSRLSRHPLYPKIIEIAQCYLRKCILAPSQTEKSFWSISCLPNTTQGDLRRLFCFNINMMETFVLFHSKQNNTDIYALINVSKDHLFKYYVNEAQFKKTYKGCVLFKSNYRAAGDDQITIEISQRETLFSLLNSPFFIHAAKTLNLRLMRKGKNIYSKYHCPQLADDIF